MPTRFYLAEVIGAGLLRDRYRPICAGLAKNYAAAIPTDERGTPIATTCLLRVTDEDQSNLGKGVIEIPRADEFVAELTLREQMRRSGDRTERVEFTSATDRIVEAIKEIGGEFAGYALKQLEEMSGIAPLKPLDDRPVFRSLSTLANSDWSGTGALSANWTVANGCTTGDVVSSAWRANNDPEGNYWNAVTPSNNQWSEAVLGTVIGGTDGAGPMIRQATAADSRYTAHASSVEVIVLKTSAGSYSQVGSSAAAAATTNTIYIEAQGTAIVVKKNGSTIITTTDSALASGRFGVFGADDGVTFPTLTSWQAGDFSGGGGVTVPVLYRQLQMQGQAA